MSASRVTVENILNALILGEPFTIPNDLYVSLHTADPGQTGANEVTLTEWPDYVRRDSLQGDTRANAWSAVDVDGVSWNQKQIIFPVFNGPAPITITHFGLFDGTSGAFLTYGALLTPRQLDTSQVFVADRNKLGVKVQ